MTPDKASKANEEVQTLTRIRYDSAFLFSLGQWNRDGEKERWRDEILLRLQTSE